MSRLLLGLIILVLIAGLLWPWLRRLGFVRLPGDIQVKHRHRRYAFPFTSTALLNLLVAIVMRLLRR